MVGWLIDWLIDCLVGWLCRRNATTVSSHSSTLCRLTRLCAACVVGTGHRTLLGYVLFIFYCLFLISLPAVGCLMSQPLNLSTVSLLRCRSASVSEWCGRWNFWVNYWIICLLWMWNYPKIIFQHVIIIFLKLYQLLSFLVIYFRVIIGIFCYCDSEFVCGINRPFNLHVKYADKCFIAISNECILLCDCRLLRCLLTLLHTVNLKAYKRMRYLLRSITWW